MTSKTSGFALELSRKMGLVEKKSLLTAVMLIIGLLYHDKHNKVQGVFDSLTDILGFKPQYAKQVYDDLKKNLYQ